MRAEFKYLTLAIVLAALTGCCPESRCGGGCGCDAGADSAAASPTATAPIFPQVTVMPQVAGKWAGRWESGGHPGHGGGLRCEATEAGAQKWAAVFTAEFGATKPYEVKLEGKPGDNAVLFGGKIDLGVKDGGVFTWTGSATAMEFLGKYEGGGDTGTFKMSRAK